MARLFRDLLLLGRGAVIGFLVVAAAWAAPQLSDRLQITQVFGAPDVQVKRALGGKNILLHTGEEVLVGDLVTVAARQMVSLAAFDGSQWKLAPGTRFTAEARKPDKLNLAYWSFRLEKGGMWGKVKKEADVKEGFRLKVRTKMAALGIRGTEYLLEGDETHSGIDVLEGTVWWGTDPNFTPGSFKAISAGSHGEIGAGGQVTVTETKGDSAKLLHAYGLDLGEEIREAPATAADCLARGKGWRSDNGSSVGECVDH